MARFCAIKAGIYNSNDPKACWRDDMIINQVTDINMSAPKQENGSPMFYLFFGGEPISQANLDKMIEHATGAAAKMEKILGD